MTDDILKTEQQFLALLLRNRDLVDNFFETPLDFDNFDSDHRYILHSIREAYRNDVLLTRLTFLDFISKVIPKKRDLVRVEMAFNELLLTQANRNDFPMLRGKILENYLVKKTSTLVVQFNADYKAKGATFAVQQLAANMASLSGVGEKKRIEYESIATIGVEMSNYMEDIRSGKTKEEDFISFGIDELDQTTQTGLSPGSLTLFCGDVASHKSNMMINVADNVWWKQKKNVLFVPLEMPKEAVIRRLLAKHTGIPSDYLNKPKSLTPEQFELVKKTCKELWPNHEALIYWMSSYEERTQVSVIRRMIEENIEIFKPRVVVVDYIANLRPDRNMRERNDLEIGEMLKDLRHMGRPGVIHDKGFAIVSGAQIGRDALRRIRRSASEKMMFYSEDIRGSHEYSADADNMFAQIKDPQQPDELLDLFCIKARNGKTTFADGSRKAKLEVKPEISLIQSAYQRYSGADKDDILKKAVDTEEEDFGAAGNPKESSTISGDTLFEEETKSGKSIDDADFFGK